MNAYIPMFGLGIMCDFDGFEADGTLHPELASVG